MTIKKTALMLAIATVLTGGLISLSASADAPLASASVTTTAPMPNDNDAAEDANKAAKEANEEATESAKEANESANEEHHDVAAANRMSKDQIIDQLKAAGYKDIDHVDFEHGFWQAKATDNTGTEVKLKLDAVDGHVISRKNHH